MILASFCLLFFDVTTPDLSLWALLIGYVLIINGTINMGHFPLKFTLSPFISNVPLSVIILPFWYCFFSVGCFLFISLSLFNCFKPFQLDRYCVYL
jgi:hypothetical protein